MGILRVTAEDQTEITAHGARVTVLLEGTTLIVGDAALDRAAEVRELAAQLQAVGIARDSLRVAGVRIANASGVLLKNQRAEFRLEVTASPGALPDVLGVIAAQKNARMEQLEWLFETSEASAALSAGAMRRARRRAAAIADAAGERLGAVENASDTGEMPVYPPTPEPARLMRTRVAPQSLEVGVDYTATRTLTVRLTVDFRLEPAAAPTAGTSGAEDSGS